MDIQETKGDLISKGKRYAIVVSRFNEFITKRLKDSAIDALMRHGVKKKEISIYWTPGSFETPFVVNQLARSKKFDAIVCLGAILRGSTAHFEIVSHAAASNISQISMSSQIPIVFGIITADTLEQAIERAGTKLGNRGWDAALTAIEMANLNDKLK